MAVKKTLQLGDPKLRAKNEDVKVFDSLELKELVKDLEDTMNEMHLIGMAAPQIGKNIRLFITEPKETKHRGPDQSDKLRVYINPEIVELSDELISIYEGCGSVLSAQLFGPVSRSKVVTIEAFDLEGKKFRYKADGILGRVILHEFDHLIGRLYTDIVNDYTKLLAVDHYREMIKSSPLEVQKGVISIKEFNYL